MSETFVYKHKGYELRQTSYNWHFMIYEEVTESLVMRAAYDKKVTEEEAKNIIEDCITVLNIIKEKGGVK